MPLVVGEKVRERNFIQFALPQIFPESNVGPLLLIRVRLHHGFHDTDPSVNPALFLDELHKGMRVPFNDAESQEGI